MNNETKIKKPIINFQNPNVPKTLKKDKPIIGPSILILPFDLSP